MPFDDARPEPEPEPEPRRLTAEQAATMLLADDDFRRVLERLLNDWVERLVDEGRL